MEGVEDIPGAALSAGIQWGWESFPEYLDAARPAAATSMDIGTQVPHGAVRAYVMGERGRPQRAGHARGHRGHGRASSQEGIEAGALGFSTSRTLAHRAIDGEPVPGTFAAEDELFGIGRVLGELGTGVFELAPAGVARRGPRRARARRWTWMRRLAAAIGRPVTFALQPEQQRARRVAAAARPRRARPALDGAAVRPQAHARTVSLLLGFQTFHPLQFTPAWGESGLGLLPWQRAGRPHRAATRAAGARSSPTRALLDDNAIVQGVHAPGPHLRARRPARLRARPRAQRRRHRRGQGRRRVGDC